jgi:hypothetical protein
MSLTPKPILASLDVSKEQRNRPAAVLCRGSVWLRLGNVRFFGVR